MRIVSQAVSSRSTTYCLSKTLFTPPSSVYFRT